MADASEPREAQLRHEYHSQTAKIHWTDLQLHYARGAVIAVSERCDLVDVAVQLGMDNTEVFQRWIEQGKVAGVTPEQALAWYESEAVLWTVVAAPWVLVQEPRTGD